jgi:small subunit ribosomal protein S4
MCRREQTKLFLKGEKCYTKCVLDNRPMPPGNAKPQRGKPSEFQIRLREKQKLRRMISMTETPFRNMMEVASHSKEHTAAELMVALETRLDNIVRRMGLATSLNTARQLVQHRNIRVNGKKVSIPSYHVNEGDVISLDPRLKENTGVKLSLEFMEKKALRPAYLEYNGDEFSAKMLRKPTREETSFNVDDQLIVEYYSR